jgi:hypothetical protein
MSEYEPHEIKLANEIANALKDRDAIPLYRQYARKYQEEFLQRKLAKAMSIEESKIRTNRAALFVFLVNQSENNNGGSRH